MNPTPTRGPLRTAWLAAGAVLTAAAVLLGTVTAWGLLTNRSTRTDTEQQSYTRKVARVDVHVPLGKVSLAAGDPGRVDVRRALTWSRAKPSIDESWSDSGTLRAGATCGNAFPPWITNRCSVGYALRTPTAAEAEVRTEIADIDVRDLTGALRLSTGPGEVSGAGLRSPTVDVAADTGDVRLGFAGSPDRVTAETGTGELDIRVPRGDAYRVDAETRTGTERIDITQDPEADRVIEAHARAGDIRVRYAK